MSCFPMAEKGYSKAVKSCSAGGGHADSHLFLVLRFRLVSVKTFGIVDRLRLEGVAQAGFIRTIL